MITINLIIGLPGSGKSYYARQNFSHIPFFDDMSLRSLNDLPNPRSFTNLEIAIADVNFCDNHILGAAIDTLITRYQYNHTVEFNKIYFENDPEKARANVARRNDGRNVEGTIKRFAPIYNPPHNALKIFYGPLDV